MMRAKLTVVSVTPSFGDSTTSQDVKFDAKYDPTNTPEDNSYSKYTPFAQATLCITNPELIGKFSPGQQFYVDFTEIKKS